MMFRLLRRADLPGPGVYQNRLSNCCQQTQRYVIPSSLRPVLQLNCNTHQLQLISKYSTIQNRLSGLSIKSRRSQMNQTAHGTSNMNVFGARQRYMHSTVTAPEPSENTRIEDRPEFKGLSDGGIDVQKVYQRKTPKEHVLLRPGMYVGSVTKVKEPMAIYQKKEKKLVMKDSVSYIPGLVKLFDEILVNAADNAQRSHTTTKIDVSLDDELITIRNNGEGIPIQIHEKEGMYVPELIFGHLMTGSNFDDDSAKLTGGRHGYGAKLTNILSEKFQVETLDSRSNKIFKQTWVNHMEPVGKPEILDASPGSEDYTEISFKPDLSIFGIKRMDKGSKDVMIKRVFDVAGILAPRIRVTLNDKQVKMDSFASYVDYYDVHGTANAIHYSKDRWQVTAIVEKEPFFGAASNASRGNQISFVNSMATLRGGTHVNHVMDQITSYVTDYVNKHKSMSTSGIRVNASHVRKHITLFVNSQIENPSFDSQMKEMLTSDPETFGSKCILPQKFLKELVHEKGLGNVLIEWANRKQKEALFRSARTKPNKTRMHSIPKLEDANWAGTAKSDQCTLILTEGDSAKALAVAGLSVIGRDKYGVFPLRGKLLNVRDASPNQIMKNEEISNLCTIIGLNFKEKYDQNDDKKKKRNGLRYGRVMIMTDQDYDGSHIKGLLINLFDFFWPALSQRPGFLCEFITPVIKAIPKGSTKNMETKSFFTLREFRDWYIGLDALEARKYKMKYYKGLGTSTSTEAREYFKNLDRHTLNFSWNEGVEDDLIDMAFSKTRSGDRKDWLSKAYAMGSEMDIIDNYADEVSIEDFINKELVLFSQHDVERSIPSVVDGLKPSQRKVLYGMLMRPNTEEVKVAQFAGFCSEKTAYHHGEASLHSTIVNMAQDFVGSNNLPLLYPSGQFGTRLQGGKDAASPRYIFTRLQPYARHIFMKSDDSVLEYQVDDGMKVEPKFYTPIIPMVIINGAEGIGTGWSTKIPPHNPLDVIDYLELLIKKYLGHAVEMPEIKPWIKGFKGEIKMSSNGYTTSGICNVESPTEIKIVELPVGRWTEDMKDTLNLLVQNGEIKSYNEYHSELTINFVLNGTKDQIKKLADGRLKTKLKLENKHSMNNMHLFDNHGCIKKYGSVSEIIEDFYEERLDAYRKRKQREEEQMQRKLIRMKNEIQLSSDVSSGSINLAGKSKEQLINELRERGYQGANSFMDGTVSPGNEYNYLLNKPIWELTKDHTQLMLNEARSTRAKYEVSLSMSAEDIWLEDLNSLKEELEKDEQLQSNRHVI